MKSSLTDVFKSIPTLESSRLILRAIKRKDAADMYAYSKNPDVTRYLLWCEHPNLEHTMAYIQYLEGEYKKGRYYDWALIEKKSGKMIGTCGFTSFDLENASAFVGYVLNPEYRGRGYAPEALQRILAFGFQNLRLHRIAAEYMEENTPSLRVMEKCGMLFEGYRRKAVLVKGRYETVGVCSILAEEFRV